MIIALRPYSHADLAACMRIWRHSSDHAHAFLGEAALDADEILVRTHYFPNADITVAEADGRIAGFIALAGTFVGGLFVDPELHRLGVGSRLLKHAENCHGPLTLEVYIANAMACTFYRALGYQEILCRTVDDSGRPYPLIRMRSDRAPGRTTGAALTVNVAQAENAASQPAPSHPEANGGHHGHQR